MLILIFFEADLYTYLCFYEVAKIGGDAHDKLSHAEEQLVRQFADNLIKKSANKRHNTTRQQSGERTPPCSNLGEFGKGGWEERAI